MTSSAAMVTSQTRHDKSCALQVPQMCHKRLIVFEFNFLQFAGNNRFTTLVLETFILCLFDDYLSFHALTSCTGGSESNGDCESR